jgi:hypothetical protein
VIAIVAPRYASVIHPIRERRSRSTVRPQTATSRRCATNQFNATGLFVRLKKQSHLLVPTVKDLTMPPPTVPPFIVDHFECYQVSVAAHTPKFVAVPNVTIEDQFGAMTVLVRKPTALCKPVDKNGENPSAPTHVDELMCYQAKQLVPPDPAAFAKIASVYVDNQFGPETLDVKKPAELCVPALSTP